MTTRPTAVDAFTREVAALGWVSDLMVAGSLATGDHRPGVSDLDLVAVTDGPVDAPRQAELTTLHRRFDAGPAAGLHLGCVYVATAAVGDVGARHPTWTHGQLVQRILSGITRAELVRHGHALLGRPPGEVLPPMTDDDVRAAARAELTGYWAWAARRPWLWLDPDLADLGLTSMARGRHALRHGDLIGKSAAMPAVAAPAWLVDHVRARRRGEAVTSPRIRTALIAWRDARRTVAAAHRDTAGRGGP
ncbi:nucleotidyltransferase domain-containing protein [Micromonospora sp. WMMC241]|uniref:nucleotidyltransferase domain-containing protein n=1 Tax=Micromonospora sp. WMMC241 TaxID=3015159 RepID=UPI0022B6073E|nr:nucleotidyltransferase domain-containing protein [Micromonospora sp. WMMC241]MCZ7439033.1 nucleotidyltransferase domain-containing protein [Micromonospora sp. WMMC241]